MKHALLVLTLCALAPAAVAQEKPQTDELRQAPLSMGGAMRQRPAAGNYISGAMLPDTTVVLPPPPVAGSPEQAADQATFQATRAYKDTPRWVLAQHDAKLATDAVLADFACALGFSIDPAKAPILVALMGHAGADMGPELDRTKNLWMRKRPYIGNEQPICVPRRGSLDDNPSYPSGHTTLEFGAALILAELVPDRAAQVMQRGRTLSESRIVCGVHWDSDVQAGMIEAATLVAALHGSARFRADMDAARVEVAGLRGTTVGTAPDQGQCRIEAEAARQSPLFRLQPTSP